MYRITQEKKLQLNMDFDYEFKDFDTFYKIAGVLTVSFKGKYVIAIHVDNLKDVRDFIKREHEYAHLMIYIILPASSIERLVLEYPNIAVMEDIKPYDVFNELIGKKGLLFDKGVRQTLYASIDHTDEAMESAISTIFNEYGNNASISEGMVAKLFVLNKTVYPRTVLLSYLNMDRWRDTKLRKCLETVGNDVALGACVKNVNKFMDDKITYFKTGKGNYITKSMNTDRLNWMYQVLVIDRGNIKDLTLLFAMYERGIRNDFIQE